MPLHVEIRVNERLIETVHIGRLERLNSRVQTSQYVVWRDDEDPHAGDRITFAHKYDEGAEVCVMKALAALAESSP